MRNNIEISKASEISRKLRMLFYAKRFKGIRRNREAGKVSNKYKPSHIR